MPTAETWRGMPVRRDSRKYLRQLKAALVRKQRQLVTLEEQRHALSVQEQLLRTSIAVTGHGMLQRLGGGGSSGPAADASAALGCGSEDVGKQPTGDAPADAVLASEQQVAALLASAADPEPQQLQAELPDTGRRLHAAAGSPLVAYVQGASVADLAARYTGYVNQLAMLLYRDTVAVRVPDGVAALEPTVDAWVEFSLASFFWVPAKAFAVSSLNLSTLERGAATTAHWAAAAARLQVLLHPQQEQQLVIAFHRFSAKRTVLLEKQADLLEQLGRQLDASADELLQGEGGRQLRQLQITQQLHEVTKTLMAVSSSFAVLCFNLLNTRQLAEASILCYPYTTCFMPLMQCLSEKASAETVAVCERLGLC